MKIRYFCLAAFSGMLTTLAIPNEIKNIGYSSIGLVAYIPLFIALIQIKNKKTLISLTIFYFLIANSLQNFWLAFFHSFGLITFLGAVCGYIPYALVLGYLLYYSLKTFKNKTLTLAILFTFYDYSKSIGFAAYPWGFSAFMVNNFNDLIQVADIFGVFFVCFIVYFFNAGIANFFIKQSKTNTLSLLFSILLVSTSFTYGIMKKQALNPILSKEIDTLKIAAIQLNIDPWLPGNHKEGIKTSIKLTKQALRKHPDTELVLWSEGVLTLPFNSYKDYIYYDEELIGLYDSINELIINSKAYFVIGSPSRTDKSSFTYQNSVYAINPNLKIENIYSKIFLVPFSEKVPFYEYKFVRDFFRQNFKLIGQINGNKLEIFKLKKFNLGFLICYDDAFPDLARSYKKQNANLLLNFSNDSWSHTDSSEWQHFVVAKFRSIENGIKTVRATNSGITAVINEYGENVQSLETFKKGYLISKIKLPPRFTTIYEHIGDLFIYALAIAVVIMTLRFYFIEKSTHLSS
ncbi:apolipoprotein N-acyltransferase [Borrelia hermsii]|uniref:Apolipoprotein N-acyltransferase n=3 Tax=Borrelia hermsii TaxID=140 RepID=A0AAN0X611_BORHE|nr:apolipoprotein N-acyltransferase [Borrelia hermsii]AAX16752.1 apolipoprotein N-acyltransferase [Borrelia hermsii DAH]AMR75592.1 Apolipoprotein N-acyltransferase [Borrelia hermsii]ANA43050.1 acyltransferase [Borrelia hermsii HS1]UCP01264.1 apolipoprotein N-acyltransferase [Borrelia hermsii]UEQ06888.1 apolipoprotein N-acyltransferase [Borrelia hermsii]